MDTNTTLITNKQQSSFPPGFRFHPSDEELIVHYLRNKVDSNPIPASIITEIKLYKYNPWELPSKAPFGEADEEWFFFTPRDRKYPNGNRPNRAAGLGYWKATGTDKHILSSCANSKSVIGVKKALVFYKGRPPRGVKTEWIMNEYRLLDHTMTNWTSNSSATSKRKGSMRLDDWVLCRVRKKTNIHNTRNSTWEDLNNSPASFEPRSYFQGLDSNHDRDRNHDRDNQTCPKISTRNASQNLEIMIDYLYKDFPMLPYIFASSQQQLPCNIETASNSTISFQSVDINTSKSREEGQYFSSPVSASDHERLLNYNNKKIITKDIHHGVQVNPEFEYGWDIIDHIQISKGEAFVNDNHDWNNSNFQYDQEITAQIINAGTVL